MTVLPRRPGSSYLGSARRGLAPLAEPAAPLRQEPAARHNIELPAGRALQQIKDRGYADKYRSRGEPIHLIGVEFSQAERSVVGFEVEQLD